VHADAEVQVVQPVLHAVQTGDVAVPELKNIEAQTAAVTAGPVPTVQLARFETAVVLHAVQTPL